MLRSDTLFGKREGNALNQPLNSSPTLGQSSSVKSAQIPSAVLPTDNNPKAADVPESASANSVIDESASKLIVGPNIKLKGVEITNCDTIVVDGNVEASIYSRVIQISDQGTFKGAAEIDIAEIRGVFDGELTVRNRLMILSTGRVSGKIRYGKLVIEEGGQVSGDVQMDSAASSKSIANAVEPVRNVASVSSLPSSGI